jgi:hypothetical protein
MRKVVACLLLVGAVSILVSGCKTEEATGPKEHPAKAAPKDHPAH